MRSQLEVWWKSGPCLTQVPPEFHNGFDVHTNVRPYISVPIRGMSRLSLLHGILVTPN